MSHTCRTATWILVTAIAVSSCAFAQSSKQKTKIGNEKIKALIIATAKEQTAKKLTNKGVDFLVASQEKNGGWESKTGCGVTCLVLKAIIPVLGEDHPAVKKGLKFLLTFQREDGGIYSGNGMLKNYESAVALSALSRLPDNKYADKIKKLQAFLKEGQWDEGESISEDNIFYGGCGYGKHKRPDLSNTQMMVEALKDSGVSKDDPAYKKALIFIQRCQMRGETNDQPYAKGSTQGGFIYSVTKEGYLNGGGETRAGTITIDGKEELRAYGTMTYAGLKSMVYAGLTKDDPRVVAAVYWIKGNWTLEQNPNMPEKTKNQALFYFYHVFGRAMEALGETEIKTADGKVHNWRYELVDQLGKIQRQDGSWVNEADRYFEGYPSLTTAYSILSLQAAYPQSTMSKAVKMTPKKK